MNNDNEYKHGMPNWMADALLCTALVMAIFGAGFAALYAICYWG